MIVGRLCIFSCVFLEKMIKMRQLDRESIRSFIVLNAFSNGIPEGIPTDTWLWQVMTFTEEIHNTGIRDVTTPGQIYLNEIMTMMTGQK